MQDVLSKPVELIDQDLDAVAGGFLDTNIASVDQDISQANASAIVGAVLSDVDQSNTAAQVHRLLVSLRWLSKRTSATKCDHKRA